MKYTTLAIMYYGKKMFYINPIKLISLFLIYRNAEDRDPSKTKPTTGNRNGEENLECRTF